jgi:hypothetical protein
MNFTHILQTANTTVIAEGREATDLSRLTHFQGKNIQRLTMATVVCYAFSLNKLSLIIAQMYLPLNFVSVGPAHELSICGQSNIHLQQFFSMSIMPHRINSPWLIYAALLVLFTTVTLTLVFGPSPFNRLWHTCHKLVSEGREVRFFTAARLPR